MVKSAKAVMADRSLALSTLQGARSDVDSKRTKLAKLRGTPGIRVWIVSSHHCLQTVSAARKGQKYAKQCVPQALFAAVQGQECLNIYFLMCEWAHSFYSICGCCRRRRWRRWSGS